MNRFSENSSKTGILFAFEPLYFSALSFFSFSLSISLSLSDTHTHSCYLRLFRLENLKLSQNPSKFMFNNFFDLCISNYVYALIYKNLQAASSILLSTLERERELLRVFLKVSQMENKILRRMNLSSFLMVSLALNEVCKLCSYSKVVKVQWVSKEHEAATFSHTVWIIKST